MIILRHLITINQTKITHSVDFDTFIHKNQKKNVVVQFLFLTKKGLFYKDKCVWMLVKELFLGIFANFFPKFHKKCCPKKFAKLPING